MSAIRNQHQAPPLPDTDLPQAAGSDFSSDVSLEPSGTGYAENLVRLQAEAAGDYFFLDLGGAAEAGMDAAESSELTKVSGELRPCATAGQA